MMTLAADRLAAAIRQLIEDDHNHPKNRPLYNNLSDEVGWPWRHLYESGSVRVPGVGTLKVVEIVKNSVDSWIDNDPGETTKTIFTIDDTGLLFSKEGWRDSWVGYSTNDGPLEEVERYEKTVLDYRPKQ